MEREKMVKKIFENNIKVRKAELGDLKEIVKLSLEEEKYFRKRRKDNVYDLKNKKMHEKLAKESIKDEKRILLIAEFNKKIIGFLYGGIIINPKMKVSKKGTLDEIFILTKYKKKGIGTKLKNDFLKWLKNKKIKYVLLYVEKNNKEAQKVYDKWGFKKHYIELIKKIR